MEEDFDRRIEAAIQRGQQKNLNRQQSTRQEEMSAEQIRNQHNEYRLSLSDYIEQALKKLANHFPGFKYETIYGSRGWGGALARDDIDRGPSGRAASFFSRIEVTVRPQNEFKIVNISGKGTIRDKEVFNWNYFEEIVGLDFGTFEKTIDKWILEFAEVFAAR